jgi:hypothetical protein
LRALEAASSILRTLPSTCNAGKNLEAKFGGEERERASARNEKSYVHTCNKMR